MLKLNVMGHMKWISQIVEDGSFDKGFVPAYEKAYDNNQSSFVWAGSNYDITYASTVIDLVNNLKRTDSIETLKNFEK
jgi:hypothetical protein|tara:strand:+ start:132 stop:365 length:234 start_codon:yes stop_codon:yes gene_type:complete